MGKTFNLHCLFFPPHYKKGVTSTSLLQCTIKKNRVAHDNWITCDDCRQFPSAAQLVRGHLTRAVPLGHHGALHDPLQGDRDISQTTITWLWWSHCGRWHLEWQQNPTFIGGGSLLTADNLKAGNSGNSLTAFWTFISANLSSTYYLHRLLPRNNVL